MFPRHYFPGRFFAARYFPQAAGTPAAGYILLRNANDLFIVLGV